MLRLLAALGILMATTHAARAQSSPAPRAPAAPTAPVVPASPHGGPTVTQERLDDLPGIGLAAAFAGETNGVLLVAGGTNFPDAMPWQGGKKAWHDEVHAWSPAEKWRVVGKLPRPMAGGASVTTEFGVLCAGGADATRVFADAFLLRVERGGELVPEPLPALPAPLAGAAAVAIDSTVFVLGGHAGLDPLAGEPSGAMLSIDLASRERRWVEHPPLPGPGRYLAVVATDGQSVYAFSGMRGDPDAEARIAFLRDAYRYLPGPTPTKGAWQRLADLPRSVAAAPSPAPVVDGCAVFLGAGVDAADIAGPMDRRSNLEPEVLAYDLATGEVRSAGHVPVSVVVAAAVPWPGGGTIVPSGEVKAGIRTPEVWRYTVSDRRRPNRR